MKILTINLRDEQINILNKAKKMNKIVSKSEFFRTLFDTYAREMIRLYDRFEMIPDLIGD